MKYTVITFIIEADPPPEPGEVLAVAVLETGCLKCVVNYQDKLEVCYRHKANRPFRWRTVEVADPNVEESTAQAEIEAAPIPTTQEEPVPVPA